VNTVALSAYVDALVCKPVIIDVGVPYGCL